VVYLEEQLSWQHVTKGGLEYPDSSRGKPANDPSYFPTLLFAWDVISLPHVKGEFDKERRNRLIKDSAKHFGHSIILNPTEAKFLDEMTDAVGITRPRGQTTVDQLVYINLYRPDGDPLPRSTSGVIIPREQQNDNPQSTVEHTPIKEKRYRRYGPVNVETRNAPGIINDWWENMNNIWERIPTTDIAKPK
jgi:hypothetical protein